MTIFLELKHYSTALKISLFIFLMHFSFSGATQQFPKNAEDYITELEDAKDYRYEEILEVYDQYLRKYPSNAKIALEKCKLISKAYYDSYDNYNPKEEESGDCMRVLLEAFPNNIEILLYQIDQLYGDTLKAFSQILFEKERTSEIEFTDFQRSQIYESLAYSHEYNDDPDLTIYYAEKAQELNDSIDLSLLIANKYFQKDEFDRVYSYLMSSLDTLDEPYELINKASLLLDIDKPKEALEALELRLLQEDEIYNYELRADIYIKNGQHEKARPLLLKQLDRNFSKDESYHKMFLYDYKHSPADSTLASYEGLMESNFWNDPLGKYRLKMMLKKPFSGWAFNDIYKILLSALLILLIVFIPSIWILPIHYASNYFKFSPSRSLFNSRWNLKSFWIFSSLYLLLFIGIDYIFNYDVVILSWLGYYTEEPLISRDLANQALFFSVALFFIADYFFKLEDLKHFAIKPYSILQSVSYAFLIFILFRMFYGIFSAAGIFPSLELEFLTAIRYDVISMNKYYGVGIGFLFVVLIGPLYEEILFRGVVLSAIESKLNFALANIIQAFIFACIHFDLNAFVNHFLLAIVLGYLVKRTNSMFIGTLVHIINNLLAFIVLNYMA